MVCVFMKQKQQPTLFKKFIADLDVALKDSDSLNGKSQKENLNKLFKLERTFKSTLLSTSHGEKTYEDFIYYILEVKKNKLSVRPYFRERQDTFSKKMFPILLSKDAKKLHKFRINYLFVKWVLDNYEGPHKKELQNTYEEILSLRKSLCETNLPLAINRAKLFWSKTSEHHVDYMDLIQDASRGLLEAIDNFVPPYKTVFRSVAIGRMTLNMSEDYSATLVKLPPKDKRILYRARKAKLKDADISGEDLKSFVNESFAGTTADDLSLIDAAANQVCSIDEKYDNNLTLGEKLVSGLDLLNEIENNDLKLKILKILKTLTPLEQKVLFLKIGDIKEMF